MEKIALEMLSNYVQAAVEDAAELLMRKAHSTGVTDSQDFAVGLMTREGEGAAYSENRGTNWFVAINGRAAIRLIKDYHDGDICLTNDPYSGCFATHMTDLYLWKPIFHGNEVVCFVWNYLHHTDIGGMVPSSISRECTEIFQEGLRLPPLKLYRAGVLNEDIVEIFGANVRTREQNMGDLRAQVASINFLERRVHSIIMKLGREGFEQGIEDLIAQSEKMTRALIEQIPDGEYHFTDYLDNDGASEMPCRVACTMKVKGSQMYLDFCGSDTQVPSSINVPTGGFSHHCLPLNGLVHYFISANATILLNAGIVRPLHCNLQPGTIMNCDFPAAVGTRSITCMRAFDVILGCLSKALPQKIPAAPSGAVAIIVVSYNDPGTGKRHLTNLEPMLGGGGATPYCDGVNAAGGLVTALASRSIETVEAQVPIRVLCYNLVPDSGGAGKYRGGLSNKLEFQVLALGCSVTVRNQDRAKFRPWGVQGGQAGIPFRFLLNPGTSREKNMYATDFVSLEPGDVVSISTPGGGGYGNPLERDQEAVLQDVRCGFTSKISAREDYGVVIEGNRIIEEATTNLRNELSSQREVRCFNFGPERQEYESVWSKPLYDALTMLIDSLPANVRYFVKREIFRGITKASEEKVVTEEDIYAIWNEMKGKVLTSSL